MKTGNHNVNFLREKKFRTLSEEYPELDKIAEKIACSVLSNINKSTAQIKSECPYKAQGTLEILINKLQEAV